MVIFLFISSAVAIAISWPTSMKFSSRKKEEDTVGVKQDPKKGKWMAFYSRRHPETKIPKTLKRIGLKSKSEAKQVEKDLVLQVHQLFSVRSYPTWKQCVQNYFQRGVDLGLSEKTLIDRDMALRAHTLPCWGEVTIEKISTSDIRILVTQTLSDRAQSTQMNILKFIRGVFEVACEDGHLPRNPCPRVKFSIGQKLTTVLNEEDAKRLLRIARELDHEWYPHWAFALMTGMRNGELYALTWEKVDLQKKLIKVDCSWNSKDGFKSTKTGDDRIIELARDLIPIVLDLRKNQDSHFVLPRLEKWDRGEQSRELRLFLLGSGLPRVRFHDLRASWATLLLSKGVPAIKVMKMGGWKDIKTMQHYTRLSGIDIKGMTEVFDFKLESPL